MSLSAGTYMPARRSAEMNEHAVPDAAAQWQQARTAKSTWGLALWLVKFCPDRGTQPPPLVPALGFQIMSGLYAPQ